MRSLLAICVFIHVFQRGLAVKCYSCASDSGNAGCADPISSNLTTCEITGGQCLKSIALGLQGFKTTRNCVPLGGKPCDGIFQSITEVRVTCFTCDNDFCNSGPKLTAVSILTFVGIVAVLRQLI